MSERDRAFLRGQLASIGIFLDEDRRPVTPTAATRSESGPVDRYEIRAVLVDLGAPAKDLEWLVASCPGVEHALGYRPTIREAWCVRCDGVTAADPDGCVPCRVSQRNLFEPLGGES